MTLAVQEHGVEQQTSGNRLHRGKFQINGRLEVLTPGYAQAPSGLVLPAGSVTSDMLAPGAVTTAKIAADATQHLIGSYAQAVSWTLPGTNVWTETPIQCMCQFSGAVTRVEFSFLIGCPTKGARIYWVVMVDGTNLSTAALGGLDAPEANFGAMCSGTFYATSPTAGYHRVGVAVYGPSGSQLFDSIWSTLYVTEQKR